MLANLCSSVPGLPTSGLTLLFSTQKSSHSSYKNGCVPRITFSTRSSSSGRGRQWWLRSPVPSRPGPGTAVTETESISSCGSSGGSGRRPRPSAPGKPALDSTHGGTGAAARGAPHCACALAPPARSRKRSSQPAGLARASAPAAILASPARRRVGEEVVGWGPSEEEEGRGGGGGRGGAGRGLPARLGCGSGSR